jgi:nucleoside-diphosphate-sugar epimerase|tara:strand:- start:2022 stop:3044 length:1023 start_codon:yes stop_codon:yes gene_type:complete
MKIIVTGSQGFIGSYICAELLDKGHKVVGIDNFSKYGPVVRPHDSHPNFSLLNMDICSMSISDGDINPIFLDADYIIAGAAMIGGISYFHKYAYDLLATNERILASTFDLAIKLNKEHDLKRILVISSSMVFENTSQYPTPEAEVKNCPPPSSTYGFQKLASEYFCYGAYEQYGLPYTIIRPFNCVGIGEDEAVGEQATTVGNIKMLMSHVLPDLIYKSFSLAPDESMPILGEGNQIRHYTNGKDIARAIRMAIESPAAINEDFNISSSVATSVRELAEIVWDKIHGTKLSITPHEPYPYDVQIRSPDVTKAKEILGFETEISLNDSIDEVIEWMRAQHG